MKLYLVRHGQTDENVLGLLNDDITRIVPLNTRGIAQVNAAANKLKDKGIEIIFTSPFFRTMQTAELLSKKLGVSVISDVRLKELQMNMDGKTYAEWKELRKKGPSYKPHLGESYVEMQNRLMSFLSTLKYDVVVIVSHESPLLALRCLVFGDSYDSFLVMKQDNAEIFELTL